MSRRGLRLLTFPPRRTVGPACDDPISEAVAYLRRNNLGAYRPLGDFVLDVVQRVVSHHTEAHAAGDWVYPSPPESIDLVALRRRLTALGSTRRPA